MEQLPPNYLPRFKILPRFEEDGVNVPLSNMFPVNCFQKHTQPIRQTIFRPRRTTRPPNRFEGFPTIYSIIIAPLLIVTERKLQTLPPSTKLRENNTARKDGMSKSKTNTLLNSSCCFRWSAMKLTPMTACITIGGSVLCFGAVDDERRTSGSTVPLPPLLRSPAGVDQ